MSSTEQTDGRGTETILLVEDEMLFRELAFEFLTSKGYNVIEAKDAEHALQLCREHESKPDLLLVDVNLPGMTGPALAACVSEIIPEVKVVLMSGYAAVDCIGVSGPRVTFLQKPFTATELTNKIREALDSN